jgi:hypothetical protein
MTHRNNLSAGFQFERPDLWIPWDTTLADFRRAFAHHTGNAPRLVAPGYYVARCQVLGGLVAQVGFHFEPSSDAGQLKELELFDNGEPDIEASYRVFHEGLVRLFGQPVKQKPSACGVSMPDCEWHVGSVSIAHYIMDRFGPEEHLRFRKEPSPFRAARRLFTALIVALLSLIYLWWSRGRHP